MPICSITGVDWHTMGTFRRPQGVMCSDLESCSRVAVTDFRLFSIEASYVEIIRKSDKE